MGILIPLRVSYPEVMQIPYALNLLRAAKKNNGPGNYTARPPPGTGNTGMEETLVWQNNRFQAFMLCETEQFALRGMSLSSDGEYLQLSIAAAFPWRLHQEHNRRRIGRNRAPRIECAG